MTRFRLLFGMFTIACSFSANAFLISYGSDNPVLSARDMFEITSQASDDVGIAPPNDKRVRIRVLSDAIQQQSTGTWIYTHRVELQRLVTNLRPPYAGDYWLTICRVGHFGVGEPAYVRSAFRNAVIDLLTDTREDEACQP